MNRRNSILLLAALAVLSLGAGLGLGKWLTGDAPSNGRIPVRLEATVLPEGRPLGPFALVDHDNQPFDLGRLEKHWSFLFFGYTHCPDICPMTLKVMEQVWKTLPAEQRAAAGAQMIFVSVDPDRDTTDKLKAYTTYFNPEFVGVTGEPAQIDRLTGQLGILYGFEDPDENDNYAVNHSSQVILVDPQARLRAVFSPPHDVERVRSDFLAILDHYGS